MAMVMMMRSLTTIALSIEVQNWKPNVHLAVMAMATTEEMLMAMILAMIMMMVMTTTTMALSIEVETKKLAVHRSQGTKSSQEGARSPHGAD